jgi:hypothetical protein
MIDAEALGKSMYNFGVAIGNAYNHAIEVINSVDWSALATAMKSTKKKVYRKHERPVLTAEEYVTKSNNWLHMHGYPTRRRGGKQNVNE